MPQICGLAVERRGVFEHVENLSVCRETGRKLSGRKVFSLQPLDFFSCSLSSAGQKAPVACRATGKRHLSPPGRQARMRLKHPFYLVLACRLADDRRKAPLVAVHPKRYIPKT